MGGKEGENPIQEGLDLKVQYEKRGGSVPFVMVNSETNEAFRLMYADSAALGIILSGKEPMLWGPDGSMWTGTGIKIEKILVDCDQDAIVGMCRGCGKPSFTGLGMPEQVKYDKEGLAPAVAQETYSGEVLMVGYINEGALSKTIRGKRATFWSTSRKKLWTKGEESGNVLSLKRALVQEDGSAVVYIVEMKGEGACHSKTKDKVARRTCFYRRITDAGNLEFLEGLE